MLGRGFSTWRVDDPFDRRAGLAGFAGGGEGVVEVGADLGAGPGLGHFVADAAFLHEQGAAALHVGGRGAAAGSREGDRRERGEHGQEAGWVRSEGHLQSGAKRAGVYTSEPPRKRLAVPGESGRLEAILTTAEPRKESTDAGTGWDVGGGPHRRPLAHAARGGGDDGREGNRRGAGRRRRAAGPVHRHRARHPQLARPRRGPRRRVRPRPHERGRDRRLAGLEPGARRGGDVEPRHPPPGRLRGRRA